MRILKLLNSKNFSILCIFFTLFFQNIFADDTVDIWKLKKKSNENKTETKEIFENENDFPRKILSTKLDEGINLYFKGSRSSKMERYIDIIKNA